VNAQAEELTSGLADVLADDLVGVYLHGSLALGCFNSEISDVDVLAVARRGLTLEEKRSTFDVLARISSHPSGVELHVLDETRLRPWRHPLSFDFHFGETWRDALSHDFEGALAGQRRDDPDLAAHVTVARAAGVALAGPPPQDVFPEVPWADYVDSLVADLSWVLDSDRPTALYRTLSPARIWATLATRSIQSKDSGAAWALERLPRELRAPLARALSRYRGERAGFEVGEAELRGYLDYVGTEIRSIASR
jgi:streptomycin 3"-adenylyltransferase